MDKKTKIDECFKLFKLDSRASQKELELAYEVLTKGKNDVQLRAYRLAFEFLMTDFYKVVDVKTETDTPEVQTKKDINLALYLSKSILIIYLILYLYLIISLFHINLELLF